MYAREREGRICPPPPPPYHRPFLSLTLFIVSLFPSVHRAGSVEWFAEEGRRVTGDVFETVGRKGDFEDAVEWETGRRQDISSWGGR